MASADYNNLKNLGYSGSLGDMRKGYLKDQGYDTLYDYLKARGYTGALPDMLFQQSTIKFEGLNNFDYRYGSYTSGLSKAYPLRISASGGNIFDGAVTTLDSFLDHSRTTIGTYLDSAGVLKSAAIDELRYDYSTGRRSILLEGQATNSCPFSETFENLNVNDQVDISTNTVVGPDLAVTADTVLGKTISARQKSTLPESSGSVNCVSCFIKYRNHKYVKIGFGAEANGYLALFDVELGTYIGQGVTGDGVVYDYGIVPAGNGWYRIWASGTTSGGAGSGVGLGLSASDFSWSNFSATAGTGFYAFGLQTEIGVSSPSSYIKTSGSTVARAADFASSDISALDLSAGFSVYFDGSITSAGIVFQMTSTAGNRIYLGCDGTNLVFEVYSGNVLQASFTSSGIALGDDFKFAARIETNNVNVAFNGTAGTADTSATFVEPTDIYFASSNGASLNKPAILNVVEFRIDTPLSDEELEAATA